MSCATLPPQQARVEQLHHPEALDLDHPGEVGRYQVGSFTYASPDNPRRDAYRDAAVATDPVDISPFFDQVRSGYWGYGSDAVPLNGRVWYPEGEGKFPAAVIVHGNHADWDFSEFGYAYLGEHLASHGIIMATVDQNFINARSRGDENDARAVLLLEHLRLITEWNEDPDHPLYSRVDTEHLYVMGHSRGGEAAVTAAMYALLDYYPEDGTVELDYPWSIRGAVSLAPIEGQYRIQNRPLGLPPSVSYLVIHGSHDGDVSAHYGLRFLQRGMPDPGVFWSSVWIYGANHAQFNTDWAVVQDPRPALRADLITLDQQLSATKTLISAFILTTSGREAGYQPLFEDIRTGSSWLPETLMVSTYRELAQPVETFDDFRPFKAVGPQDWNLALQGFSFWRERLLPFSVVPQGQQDSWALEAAWEDGSEILPEMTFSRTEASEQAIGLRADLMALELGGDADYLDFTLRVTGMSAGAAYQEEITLSELFTLQPLPLVRILSLQTAHYIPQTVTWEFSRPIEVTEIAFIFNGTAKEGRVIIDHVNLMPGGAP